MKRPTLMLAAAALCGAAAAHADKYPGLAPTPPMGWNTWNTFAGNISEALVEQTADALVATGMRDAGYNYVVVDDCWERIDRDADGSLVADPKKFPHGMKALGDYLHARGFKFGLHNCAGKTTCAGFPGGRGHEFQDARTYASWGVDFLKYDWCDHGTANGPETYRTMSDALRAAKRPILLSICEWGQNQPWLWAEPVAQMWRTTGDVAPQYQHVGTRSWEHGWKDLLDQNVGLEGYAGPEHWNDPDMLEAGNPGLTDAESRAQFSLWCVLAAPLIAGNDVRSMTPQLRDLLTNRRAIAIDQDPLGREGFRYRIDPDKEIWAKPLSGGEWAVCILNPRPAAERVRVDLRELTFLTEQYYSVTNVWTGQSAGQSTDPQAAELASHDVLFLRLKPSKG
ncbi:MAG TPA: glycoside hydrolase family 27 protein [Opitutaceae bacterium]|jgi:alpha-galactosidase|nr:glycoside hydrolase family 27 protein [Opitutaceae bacterium]